MTAERVAIRTLDARSWLEVYDANGHVRAEYHSPRRGSSVGWIDNPVVCTASTIDRAVSAVLAGTAHERLNPVTIIDAGAVVARIEAEV